RLPGTVVFVTLDISDMDDFLACNQLTMHKAQRSWSMAKELCVTWRCAEDCCWFHLIAAISPQNSDLRLAKLRCLLQHRIKNRPKVAGRRIDHPQDLSRGGLLFKRFARLVH